MTTDEIALIAGIGGLVLAMLLTVLVRASRRQRQDEVSRALAEMGCRMDELASQLGTAIERVRSDRRLPPDVLDLAEAGDLEEILVRTIEAVSLVDCVDAALVRVEGPDGHTSVTSVSIPLDLAEAQLVSGPPDGRTVGAVRLSYLYRGGDEPPGALRSGIAVPVAHAGRPLGFLAAYSLDLDLDEHAVVEALSTIAEAAAGAIDSALTAAATNRLGPTAIDSLTGLGNRTGFHDALARELHRSRSASRPLAVLLLDLDDFRLMNTEIGQLAGDDVLRWTAGRIRECLRDADTACRVGSDEFAVVLPDAGRAEAEGMFARVQATILRQPPESAPSVTLSGGIAEAGTDDDALELFHRAEEALGRAKSRGRGTAV